MKVNYQCAFVIGSYLQEKIGFEIEIPTNTDEEALKAVSHLRDLAEKAHRERYPQRDDVDSEGYRYVPPPEQIPVVQKEKDNREETIRQLIEEIQSCKTTKQLDIYKYLLKQYPETQSEYDKQLQIIQNQPS